MRKERPEQMSMHLWEVDATMEDTDLLGIEGRAQSATVPVTGFHVWWRESSMVDAYQAHSRTAQLLHSRRPPCAWLFKSPHMSFHLEDFVAAYPQARFVLTHRDPLKAVPSWVSFVSSLFPPGTADVTDLTVYGPHLAAHLAVGTERMIEARHLGDERFFDLHHDRRRPMARSSASMRGSAGAQRRRALGDDRRRRPTAVEPMGRPHAGAVRLDRTACGPSSQRTDHFDVRLRAEPDAPRREDPDHRSGRQHRLSGWPSRWWLTTRCGDLPLRRATRSRSSA
jgi:hypothetical protein